MNENGYYDKENTYPDDASDDSSYMYPVPFLTEYCKGKKSRLGTRTKRHSVLQSVNQNFNHVEQNNEHLKVCDDLGDNKVSQDSKNFSNSYDDVDLIEILNFLPDVKHNNDADSFIKALDSNQNSTRSEFMKTHDISSPKPLDLREQSSISKSSGLREPSLIRVYNGYQDISTSKSFLLREPSLSKIDEEREHNVSKYLDQQQPNSFSIGSQYQDVPSESEKFKPIELVKSPILPLNFAPEESHKLSEPVPFPGKESQKKCDYQPNISNNPEHEFKQPESLPPPKQEIENFQPPPEVPLNPKTSNHLPSRIFVRGKSYKIVNVLGSGGSSLVYQVLHPENNETLAIKRVDLTGIDKNIEEKYIDEVQVLKRLQKSEFIVKMYDHEMVQDNGKKFLYVIMEKGETDLAQLIRSINKTKKPSILMILYYWYEMLSAVLEIHNNGVIHSDLKPANFLLVKGRLKLIDFGIASSIPDDKTSIYKEEFTGTLNYMSPEAIRFSESEKFRINYKTDVWSLGCILYSLIYRRLPFQHLRHDVIKMQAIMDTRKEVEFPETEGVPAVLMQALKSCLRKDPKERMSVSELLELPYCGN